MIRKFKGPVKIIPILSMTGLSRGNTRTATVENPDDMITQRGFITFSFPLSHRDLLCKWVESWQRQPDYPETDLEIEFKMQPKHRSLNQNALYWALITVLAQEVYRQAGWEETIHEEILAMYAPKLRSKLHGREVPKRSKDMDTREFTQLIEAVMYEINEQGITMTEPADMDKYWRDYQKIRWEGGKDHGYRAGETLSEYRERVNYCEACRKFLRPGTPTYDGQLAHIVSRGAQGSDETWNILHLCAKDHGLQHQKGWDFFLEKYPHLENKVINSREKHAGVVEEEDDGQLDIF